MYSEPNTDPTASPDPSLKDKVQQSLESGKKTAASCCESVSNQSSQLCESTCDGIRKNPLAAVIGAAFVGAAVCYLILEGRQQPTFRERYLSEPLSNANDRMHESFGSALSSLKFW
jgi:ElaB/YqjD/DUF883 family membrane-anchored ribosome-binding protein